jgi:23S rRNA pseudouridine2605 synthase
MIHPRHHIPKTYEINLQGILSDEDIRKIRKGFTYNDQTYAPAKVFVKSVDNTRERSLVDLTIYEGQNHQVKNMMEALGHQVRRLNRSRFGFVTAQGLRPGEYRKLKMFDVKKLVRMSEEEEQ